MLNNFYAFLLFSVGMFGIFGIVFAASNSNFQLNITAGTLTTDIVDASYESVSNPSVTFSSIATDLACASTTATFGTSSQRIYVKNVDAADNGWTLTIAATSGTEAMWTSGASDMFDFNDTTSSGCDDGVDTDSQAGSLTINPTGSSISAGECENGCGTTGISAGSSASFNEGTLDDITLMSASAGADDIADVYITGISLLQTIPAGQTAATDYALDMTLTVTAS